MANRGAEPSKSTRRRPLKRRSHKIGVPAGTPVYIGDKQPGDSQTRITVIEYDGSLYSEREVKSADELFPLKPAPTVTWINVDAVHDVALLSRFGELFHLHPLLLEDILNTDQRPKYDYLENNLYIILKMFDFDPTLNVVLPEQVSIVVGADYVITFQEQIGDEFEPVRERLRGNGSRIRKSGSDYLAYVLIDTVVDRYFIVLEKIGEALETLESSLPGSAMPDLLNQVHHIRRELIFLRKYIWPVREVIGSLQRADTELMHPQTITYLRDVYEHTVQVMDTLETYRDLLGGVQDLYLSIMSNRMNEIMKVLTVISTIFIPLTFLVGVYGMNFKYMPELVQPWGYPILWVVMLSLAAGMVAYFKRKHWL